ncbi:Gfo/Idh/MocA family protein [Humisphaera borealis]|uniref:Gfo/Idh/MocA family oxidoreductase n=1 Tax=Humisphaera borealis TaxID=2807512 RepID=A0A7M2WUK6_9BACT|nr:Gfo/Idh/MocA family oxidoreductase [Humisphaera borealis]QOV88852.1 Gfo/Idh/MocA family oxidoreductase [Humisphaera borealis]
MSRSFAFLVALTLSLLAVQTSSAADAPPPLRVGIIGLDTSHAGAFTKLMNDPKNTGDLANMKVVAAFPGGSKDIESSASRVEKYTADIKAMGVEIVDSIPALLTKVDCVLLESVDGRPHLEQVRPVFAAGKPVFIDKPLAGSLVDALTIAELGEKSKTPWFSSSSLRYGPGVALTKANPKLGEITGVSAWSPCSLEKTHPDLYWYGIHGCEMLYTYMGPGCQTVSRTQTEGTDFVVGTWKDGRIGTFRGIRQGKADYGATVYGTKGSVAAPGYEGYKPLLEVVATFFRTGKPPIAASETIELMAFMEAADESKRQGGKPVSIADVLEKARAQVKATAK